MIFPAAEIHHLPRVKSDHCPILLIFDPLERKPPKPFCFEQMWLIDPFFLELVAQSWDASENLPSALSSLCSFPRRLAFLTNKLVFGIKPILVIFSSVKTVCLLGFGDSKWL